LNRFRSAFKRIKNILRQAAETGKQVAPAIDANAFQDAAEKELAAQIPRSAKVDALRRNKDTSDALYCFQNSDLQ
jgi:glycyl-tRNA synthetase beta subunit